MLKFQYFETLNTFCSIPEYVRYCPNRYHIGISEKKKASETAFFAVSEAVFISQTLGLRDLFGCFSVHICEFYSLYSSYFTFLCTSPKIFRAKIEPDFHIRYIAKSICFVPCNCSIFLTILFISFSIYAITIGLHPLSLFCKYASNISISWYIYCLV